MATYKLIIQNIINTGNNIFLHFEKNNKIKRDEEEVDGIVKSFFSILLNKDVNNVKEKFVFFEDTLNSCLIKNKKDHFINCFYKVQKTYNTLNRFVYNFKYKKARIVVNTDMYLNELDINNSNVLCLFHNNSKYLFIVNDLIKIIETSLTNSHMFFAEPLSIKNPYSNLPFNKALLYNIYIFIRYKTNSYSELFFRFFNCDFNLFLFRYKNEYLLREYSIKNYVYKSPNNILCNEIKEMLSMFNNYCKFTHPNNLIKIEDDFPKEILIKVMRPYLLLYCESEYSYVTNIKHASLNMLRKKLIKFNNFNPQFGRKRYKIELEYTADLKKQIRRKIVEFNDKHIKFNDKMNESFFTNHLDLDNFYTHTNINTYTNNSNNNQIFNFNFMNQEINNISNEQSHYDSDTNYETDDSDDSHDRDDSNDSDDIDEEESST